MNRAPMTAVSLVMFCLGVFAGCRKDDAKSGAPEPSVTPAPTTTSRAPARADDQELKNFLSRSQAGTGNSAALPPGHPPIDGAPPVPPAKGTGELPMGHPPVAGANAPTAPALPPLAYDAPENWKKNAPSRPFRAAEFDIPHAESDSADGQMIVYYFGPNQGGGIEDNLARWSGMFTTSEGKSIAQEAITRNSFEANGLKVTTIDVQGRYADRMSRPGQAGPTPEDFRLLGGIVETPDGNWFFKAVGPAATMAAQRDVFETMMKSMRQP